MSTRPEWLYGKTPAPRKPWKLRMGIGLLLLLLVAVLVFVTGCKSKGEPTPNPNDVAAQSAPVKAPQVPETIGTSVSVTLYDVGTVVPVDTSKLPHVDCWYEIATVDVDKQPGGDKIVEVKAICP